MQLPPLPRKIEEPDFKQPPTLEEVEAELNKWLVIRRMTAFRIGSLLDHTKSRKLYKPKYPSFNAWLSSLKGPSKRTLQRYKDYAYRVSRRVSAEHDPERIDYALALLPKKGNVTPISDRLIRGLQVEVIRRGVSRKVPFAEASTVELELAAERAQKNARPKHKPEFVRECEALQKKLGAGPGALGDAKLLLRRGRSVARIELPAERLPELLKLLK